MSNVNTVTLAGNLTRDPELCFTASGQATAGFGLAVSRWWRESTTGEWQEATSFFDVVCWHEIAENVTESLTRGVRVVVTGRLEQRSWETPEGEKRSKIEVVAEDVGPSLRWATVTVNKNERRSPGDASSAAISAPRRLPQNRTGPERSPS